MIGEWILELITSPVFWFWSQYKKCLKKREIAKVFGLLFASLCGLTVIGLLLVFIIIKLVNFSTAHPTGTLVAIGVVCLYIYVYSRNEKELNKSEETEAEQAEKDSKFLRDQAALGYAPMLNAMYQSLRDVASDIGGIIPTMTAEIEVFDGHFILKNGVCLYQFKLDKSDPSNICDEALLREYANTIQYRIRCKIESGAFPSIKLSYYRDNDGNGYDGIVIDHVDDFGRYYIVYATYPTQEYSQYKRSLIRKTENVVNSLPKESWEI